MKTIKAQSPYQYILAFSLLGLFFMLYITHAGIGVSPDSITYIQLARNAVHGRGLVLLDPYGRLMATGHFPPFFPSLLATLGFWGIDALDGARWLNALIFALNIFLAGFLTYRCSRKVLPALLASAFMMLSLDMLKIHSMAWTEPLFLALTLGSLYLLALYIEEAKTLFLYWAGILTALSIMDRYAGLALLASGMAAILFLDSRGFRQKCFSILIYGSFSFAALVLWGLRNYVLSHHAVDRKAVMHPIGWVQAESGIHTVWSWFWPSGIYDVYNQLYICIISISIGIGIYLIIRHSHKNVGAHKSDAYLPVLSTFIIIYFVLISVSITWFDAATPLDYRILSPVYAVLLVLLAGFFSNRVYAKPISRIMLTFMCVVGLVSYAVQAVSWAKYAHSAGQGFTSREWKASPTIQMVRSLPDGAVIYSNAADVISFLTGKPAFLLPYKNDSGSLITNKKYNKEMADMKNKGNFLVYFGKVHRTYFPTEEELKDFLPMRQLGQYKDGAIYKIGDSALL